MVATSRFIVCHVTALPFYNIFEKIATPIYKKLQVFRKFVYLHKWKLIFYAIFTAFLMNPQHLRGISAESQRDIAILSAKMAKSGGELRFSCSFAVPEDSMLLHLAFRPLHNSTPSLHLPQAVLRLNSPQRPRWGVMFLGRGFILLSGFVFETSSPLRQLNVLINLLSDIYKFCPPAGENDADRILSVGFVVSKTIV